MPGIHVRTVGRLHWEDQDKEPTLTVPGSYWLCHKNNIYKFTFKFHKTIRNTVDFPYSKELMKIIRRIIKWQPRQGQHFSTKNLLVTYNHASWTRQDKMFAVMKFSDRPDAKAFSHAFILTVKIVDKDRAQQTEETMGGLVTKPDSESPVVCSLEGEPLQERSPSKNCQKDIEDIMPTSSHTENDNKSNSTQSPRTRSRHIDPDSLTSTNVSTRQVALPEKCEPPVIGQSVDEGFNNEADDGNNSATHADNNWQCKPAESSKMPSSSRQKRSTPINEDENSNSSKGSQSDSASLPYQYFIERDIERELENSRNAKTSLLKESNRVHVNGVENPCDSSFNDANADPDTGSKTSRDNRKGNKQKSRSDSKDSDSLPPPEVANLRSSDITDLVMKGLMFTIRQDKDTVTVVEQKTKLEVDEVLENSEKVETKEGDPCLLNSSLLRLEKMITRMQEPPASLSENKRNGSSENALVSFMDLANEINIENEQRLSKTEIGEKKEMDLNTDLEAVNCWSQFFTDKDITDSTFENIEKVLEDSSMYINDDNLDVDLELKMDGEEEEEDIVPEALRNQEMFKNGLETLRKTSTSLPSFPGLLMDDDDQVDIKVIDVEDINVTTSTSSEILNANGTNIVKDISKRPKVISNQIITSDQIPPALLKALKNKPIVQSPQTTEVNKNFNKFNEVPENNNKINMQTIKEKMEDVKTNFVKNDEIILQKGVESNIKDKKRDYVISDLESGATESSKISCNIENVSNEKIDEDIDIEATEVSNTNLNSAGKVRLTRSNSKLPSKSSKTSVSVTLSNNENSLEVKIHRIEKSHFKSNDTSTKNVISPIHERSIETRTQWTSEKLLQKSNKTLPCSTFNGNTREHNNFTETQATKQVEDKSHLETREISSSELQDSITKSEYSVETRSKKFGDKVHSKSNETSPVFNGIAAEHENCIEIRSGKTGDKLHFKSNEISSTFNGRNTKSEHSIGTRSRKSGDKLYTKSGETLTTPNKNAAKHENFVETRSKKHGDKLSLNFTETSSENTIESENSIETRSNKSGVKLHSKSNDVSSIVSNGTSIRPERSIETRSQKIGDKSHMKSNETSSSTFNGKTIKNELSVETRSQKVEEKSYLKSNSISSPFNVNARNERTIETRAQKIIENNSTNEVNKFLLNKAVVNRKRRSASDQVSLKRQKSENINGTDEKEVTVEVWKLLNHLRYGVKVVVERMDVKHFSR